MSAMTTATASQPKSYQTTNGVTFDKTFIPKSVSEPMSLYLPTVEHVQHLTHINGLSIEEVEKRARPGGHFTYGSQCGFMGVKDSFPAVVMKDCESAASMGTTLLKISELLDRVRDVSYEAHWKRDHLMDNWQVYASKALGAFTIQRFPQSLWDLGSVALDEDCFTFSFQGKEVKCWIISMKPLDLESLYPDESKEYDVAYANKNKEPQKYEAAQKKQWDLRQKGQKIWDDCFVEAAKPIRAVPVVLARPEVTLSPGGQWDLFRNHDVGIGLASWNANFRIYNAKTGKTVTIAEGLIDYMRYLGFCEGNGDGKNEYRLDPVDVMSVFTGLSAEEIMKGGSAAATAASTATAATTTAASSATAATASAMTSATATAKK